MNSKNKLMNLLGLAQRAGKLETGSENVLKSLQRGQAHLVFIAADASQNTRKKFTDKAAFYSTSLTDALTEAEISSAIGKKRSLVAVLDQGFAKSMEGLLEVME